MNRKEQWRIKSKSGYCMRMLVTGVVLMFAVIANGEDTQGGNAQTAGDTNSVTRMKEIVVTAPKYSSDTAVGMRLDARTAREAAGPAASSPFEAVENTPSVNSWSADPYGLAEVGYHETLKIRGVGQTGPASSSNIAGLPITVNPCGTVTDIFKSGGGEKMAADMGVPFLGRIPIDPAVGDACDDGKPFVYHYNRTETAKAFEHIVTPILALSTNVSTKQTQTAANNNKKEIAMKIAIPIADGKLCMHFGHCEQFALLDVDEKTKKVTGKQMLTPPPHEPGVLPRWLHQQGANVIVAGGMGQRAQSLFAENSMKVIVGAPGDTPEKLASAYLDGTLKSGDNVCDH